MAQALQLNGARQSMPITVSAGGFVGTPDPPDPTTINQTLDITTTGSAMYSFATTYWMADVGCPTGTPTANCPTWSVSPAMNLTVTETMSTGTMNLPDPNNATAPMRTFGMLVTAASPSLPAVGSYAPSWTFPNGGRLTHLAVAIAPAQAP
jgi:hypothetical protein